ncbi:S1C family serine protease [Adlercreutzia sp. ZJ138]|uniref:S1C family serine protease n=1 Tax=Adlercreutzia sp. ZJ138 TaxID=2709405 RepID=UPI0013ED9521|nr:trypsin-like peptidase domain-containing protein [Adlercreutzia sp. ZJ138]
MREQQPYQPQQPSSQQSASHQAPTHGTNPTRPYQSHQGYTAPVGQQPYAYGAPYSPVNGTTTVKRESNAGKTFLLGFAGAALACVLGLGGFAAWQMFGPSNDGSGSPVQLGSSGSSDVTAADEDATLAEAVAQKALPSVAAIDVYTTQSDMYGFGASTGELAQSSLGSGVVLSEDGYILTNYHVVQGAEALKVTVEGAQYDAEVVGSDPSSDLAVVKAANASGLRAIELGDSDNLTIGEWVMSIGSPFGLEQSVATGIVSATSRSQIMDSSAQDPYGMGQGSGTTTIYANLIQTDAAINPGNSGGALVDADGKLIGINTLITSYSGNYSGVGFAIPVNYAVNIAQQIIDGKTPTHAQLGVSLSNVTAQNAQRYGLSVESGAYIAAVAAGSGAAEAGLQEGDIVTKFDGKAVESASDLMLDVRSKNPGDTVTLEINRGGETQEVQVTLGSDEETQQQQQQQQQRQQSGESIFDLLRNLDSNQLQDAA